MTAPTNDCSNRFETLVIVGVGLIGGSVAAAVKKRRVCGRVIGVGRSAGRLQAAQRAGLIDEAQTNLPAAAAEADLLLFCTPVDCIAEGVLEAAPHCAPGTLLTDAGSVKERICRRLEGKLPKGITFIGSHPLAGSEKNGFEHADADLFCRRVCVVTPGGDTPPPMLARLKRFWEALGMRVVETSPQEHDRLLAATSHLPHVLAAALALLLDEEYHPFAASGLRDTTRIAAGDPALWTAIVRFNRRWLVEQLQRYESALGTFRQAVENDDPVALKNLLQRAKTNLGGLDES